MQVLISYTSRDNNEALAVFFGAIDGGLGIGKYPTRFFAFFPLYF